jgi:hypothetical protein
MADENLDTAQQTVGGDSVEVSQAVASKLASIQRATGQESSLNVEVKQDAPPADQPPATDAPSATDAPPAATENPEDKPADAPVTDAPSGSDKPEDKPADKPADDLSLESEVAEINSKITGKVNLAKDEDKPSDQSPTQQGFEKWEDFENFVKEVGYDGITKENAAEKLTEVFENSKKVEEFSTKLKNYDLVWDNLPEDLMTGVRAWADGKDHREAMSSVPSLDLSKKFEDHGDEQLIEKYFPGQITSEEWEEAKEADADPQIKAKVSTYKDLSREKYNLDQAKFNQQKEAYQKNAQETMQKIQESFDKSREYFPKAFEESSGLPVQQDYVSEVDKVVKDQNSVLSVFFNADGSLKEDAHYRMAMALDGGDMVSQQAAALKNKLVTQAREEVVKDTPEATAIKKTGDQTSLSDAEKAQQRVKGYVSKVLPTPDDRTYG